MIIENIFSSKTEGLIVIGYVNQGMLSKGDTVKVANEDTIMLENVLVKKIEALINGKVLRVESIKEGEHVALYLDNIELKRGDTIIK